MAEPSKTLKEGERILGPTRRPDGTLRKPIRIRAGHVPQDEVAIYQSKGALLRKELTALQEVPPGYDPPVDAKPRSKSGKRNEKGKEKRQQAAIEQCKNVENVGDDEMKQEEVLPADNLDRGSASTKSLTSQMNELSVSANSVGETPLSNANAEDPTNAEAPGQDIDRRIRALKKKIRLAETQQKKTGMHELKPEQLEKLSKLEGWREEVKILEAKKAELEAS